MAAGSLTDRMIRASRLDINLYEEVEADSSLTGQAFRVILLVSLATGIGSGITGVAANGGAWFIWGLLIGLVSSVIGWLAWSFLVYLIGTTIFKTSETKTTWGELLRTIGFANSPGVLRIFSFIPVLGGLLSFAVTIWTLFAGVIAVRQALDFSTGRAIATCVAGWIINAIILFLIGGLLFGNSASF